MSRAPHETKRLEYPFACRRVRNCRVVTRFGGAVAAVRFAHSDGSADEQQQEEGLARRGRRGAVRVARHGRQQHLTDTGLTGGNVRALYTSNANLAFARAGDKFYKSTDGGVTWATKLSQNTQTSGMALNPANANVVVLLWSDFAILRSIDGGETFASNTILVDFDWLQFSQDGTQLYATTSFQPYVRRSADNGVTWSSFANNGLPAQPMGSPFVPMPRVIGVHPSNADALYIGFRDALLDGIYKSVDGGANWTVATGTFGAKVWSIAVSAAAGNPAYAAAETGLLRTTDGQNWAHVPDPAGTGVATASVATVTIDPADPNVVYAGGAQRGEIWRSTDGGASWARRDSGVVASAVNSLSVRPGSPAQLLAGTSVTLYRSTNTGQAWNASANGIRVPFVATIQAGARMRVGLADGGVYESLDRATWTPLDNAGLRASQPNNLFGEVPRRRRSRQALRGHEQWRAHLEHRQWRHLGAAPPVVQRPQQLYDGWFPVHRRAGRGADGDHQHRCRAEH